MSSFNVGNIIIISMYLKNATIQLLCVSCLPSQQLLPFNTYPDWHVHLQDLHEFAYAVPVHCLSYTHESPTAMFPVKEANGQIEQK